MDTDVDAVVAVNAQLKKKMIAHLSHATVFVLGHASPCTHV